jgi:hypothetical protein
MQNPIVSSSDATRPSSLFRRVWPPSLLILGLGVTVAWTVFLGYKFVKLIGMSL